MSKTTTLRSIITHGNLDPKYSMRIWIQVMKVLASKHRENTFYGSLSPDDILIDMQNNVEIVPGPSRREVYTAPEVLAGEAPGPHSDIFSLGAVLFEMVVGSVDQLGSRHPSELREDVPPWLDELILKCTKKDRRDRFLNTDDVSASLLNLKNQT